MHHCKTMHILFLICYKSFNCALAELQCHHCSVAMSKQKYIDIGIPDFYRFPPIEIFPHLHSAAAEMMAVFVSTYIYKQVFSSKKL